MALALRLGLLATSARRASIASRPGRALTRTGVRTFAVGGDGASSTLFYLFSVRPGNEQRQPSLTRLSHPSTRTSSLALETHIAGFVDDATLLGLEKATLLDVRGVEGPGEVADDPSPKGAVNATWDTLNMGFVDPAKLPADKNAPVVVF